MLDPLVYIVIFVNVFTADDIKISLQYTDALVGA